MKRSRFERMGIALADKGTWNALEIMSHALAWMWGPIGRLYSYPNSGEPTDPKHAALRQAFLAVMAARDAYR